MKIKLREPKLLSFIIDITRLFDAAKRENLEKAEKSDYDKL